MGVAVRSRHRVVSAVAVVVVGVSVFVLDYIVFMNVHMRLGKM
jgi:hypothetical protein